MPFGNWFKKKPITMLGEFQNASGERIGTIIFTKYLKRDPNRLDLVYCTFKLAGEMPTQTEMDMFQIAQARMDLIEEKMDCCNVAMMMIGGKRDYIFYAASGVDLADRLSVELGEFNPQFEIQFDPLWSQYRDIVHMKSTAIPNRE